MSKPDRFQTTAEAVTAAAAAAITLGPTPLGVAALAVGATVAIADLIADEEEGQ